MGLIELRQKVSEVRGRRNLINQTLTRLGNEVSALETKLVLLDKTTEGFRHLIDLEIKSSLSAVEQLLTGAMREVFDDQDLSVKANVEVLRGKVSIDLITCQKTGEFTVEGSAEDSFGGSLLSLQSLLLRIILIHKRKLRPFLVLDESFSAFDNNYVHNFGLFLDSLCKKVGLDILLITHPPALFEAASHAYRAYRKGDSAGFQKLR